LEPAGTPLPGTPQVEPAATSAFSPQPGDKVLDRGNLFVEDAGITVQPGDPAQVLLSLSGNRPTPCHQLRVAAGQPDANGVVQVDAYTVTDPTMMCMQVLRPFAEVIPLGPFAPGRYTVVVNDELRLDFTV
jgi:hypothetical protein